MGSARTLAAGPNFGQVRPIVRSVVVWPANRPCFEHRRAASGARWPAAWVRAASPSSSRHVRSAACRPPSKHCTSATPPSGGRHTPRSPSSRATSYRTYRSLSPASKYWPNAHSVSTWCRGKTPLLPATAADRVPLCPPGRQMHMDAVSPRRRHIRTRGLQARRGPHRITGAHPQPSCRRRGGMDGAAQTRRQHSGSADLPAVHRHQDGSHAHGQIRAPLLLPPAQRHETFRDHHTGPDGAKLCRLSSGSRPRNSQTHRQDTPCT